jgi:hypothetical protein
MSERKVVLVSPGDAIKSSKALFDLWRSLYPVEFSPWEQRDRISSCGAIFLGPFTCSADEFEAAERECLVAGRFEAPMMPVERTGAEFSDDDEIDRCFRGQSLVEEEVRSICPLPVDPGARVVCRVDGKPFWTIRRTGKASVSRVALPPPDVASGQTLYEVFNRRCWLQMLPFLHFLKRVTRDEAWGFPPVRACLMFDDPNLHAWSYGHIDFRELIKHAAEHRYHVSFATIPFDGWFVHEGVAAMFRENTDRVSLCMHGNDHAGAELGGSRGREGDVQMLAQALLRTERMEQKSGVPVSRVMVPPHGAFCDALTGPMVELGYEALCVSRASLKAWNKHRAWEDTFGQPMAEFVDGLTVIPRQVLRRGHEGSYRLAAFLGQPIIPHAHHQDCAEGLDLLATAAGSINQIGDVVWSDMTGISRSNYVTRLAGDTLRVRMQSRRVVLDVGAACRQVSVERPWVAPGTEATEVLAYRFPGVQTDFVTLNSPSCTINAVGRRSIEVISRPLRSTDYRMISPRATALISVARRLVSESRDRASSLIKPWASRRRKKEPIEITQGKPAPRPFAGSDKVAPRQT